MEIAIIIFLIIIMSVIAVQWQKARIKNKFYEKKYAKIINIDNYVKQAVKARAKAANEILQLKNSYKDKKKLFDKLAFEV
ncbi:hypothetical protein QUF61_16570 [Candidatus Venteria ishoeyi]|uniref:hypothetical protein n=1 Tax=Candidatus Venteria ishoeyi TaxID=1899563 RepID=UPI0025A66F50|nr:hypothetical protein [Candidatus Venteria ishoeyi]MDM8548104.1 hypothetical protein [Candidatus Venteria ishoeyi]